MMCIYPFCNNEIKELVAYHSQSIWFAGIFFFLARQRKELWESVSGSDFVIIVFWCSLEADWQLGPLNAYQGCSNAPCSLCHQMAVEAHWWTSLQPLWKEHLSMGLPTTENPLHAQWELGALRERERSQTWCPLLTQTSGSRAVVLRCFHSVTHSSPQNRAALFNLLWWKRYRDKIT